MRKTLIALLITCSIILSLIAVNSSFDRLETEVILNEEFLRVVDDPTLEEYASLNEVFSDRDIILTEEMIRLNKEMKEEEVEVDYVKLLKLERLKAYQMVIDRWNAKIAAEKERFEEEEPVVTKEGHLSLLGRIVIESINVNMPLVEGTSASDIAISAGHLENTAYPGHIGNAVVAGHRGYNFGLLFNRLDELDKGDRIVLTTSQGTFTYEVYQTKVVTPDDLSVISQTETHRVLTLITCTPLYKSTHRLIIHALLVE